MNDEPFFALVVAMTRGPLAAAIGIRAERAFGQRQVRHRSQEWHGSRRLD